MSKLFNDFLVINFRYKGFDKVSDFVKALFL